METDDYIIESARLNLKCARLEAHLEIERMFCDDFRRDAEEVTEMLAELDNDHMLLQDEMTALRYELHQEREARQLAESILDFAGEHVENDD